MAIYYVEAIGSNTYPYDTRAKAANNLTALWTTVPGGELSFGDIVYVFGTVTEPNAWTAFFGNGAQVIGESPQTTIINLSTCYFDYCSLYNITGIIAEPDAAGSTIIYDPPEVMNCKFDGSNIMDSAIVCSYKRPIKIIGNTFENFVADVIVHNGSSGPGYNLFLIIGNSFNHTHEVYLNLFNDASVNRLHIYNNAVNDGLIHLILTNVTISEFFHDHNVSSGGYTYILNGSSFTPDVTEITANPLFLGAGTNNRLAINGPSPCFHTGITRSTAQTTDVIGSTFNNPPSIGAYEVPIVFYVEATGSNSYPFNSRATAATSFYELFLALNNLGIGELIPGDIVYVNGEITEPNVLGYYPIYGASIIGTDSRIDKINMSNCYFEGDPEEGCNITNIQLYTDSETASSFIHDPSNITNCRFDGRNLAYQGFISSYARNMHIIGNTFANFISEGFSINTIDSPPTDEIIIAANSLDNVGSLLIRFQNTILTTLHIFNNAFRGNEENSFIIFLDNMLISEFIHSNNRSNAQYNYLMDFIPFLPDITEIVADPLFLGVEPNPLLIDNLSPCYHNGTSLSGILTNDIIGTLYTNPPSIGAYEVDIVYIVGTGALKADNAIISGLGLYVLTIIGTGELIANDARISGVGSHITIGEGTLIAEDAEWTGTTYIYAIFEGLIPVLPIDDTVEKSNGQPIDNRNRVLDISSIPEEEWVVKPFEPTMLLHLNFDSYTPIEFGLGPLSYAGGGNRFVQNNDQILVVQTQNQDPMYNRFPAYSEIEAINLIENDFNDGIPDTYEITGTELSVSSDTFTHDAIQGVQGLQIIVHDSNIINGMLQINTPLTAINIAEPVAFSTFLGIQPYRYSQLNKLNINFVFYNGATLIGTVIREIDTDLVLNTIGVISGVVNVADIPATTTHVRVQVELTGLDRGERFMIQMILPQVVQSLISTTPIFNINTRRGDVYSITQSNNFNINAGSIELTYVPGINDNILTSTIFDSTLSGLNGIRIVLHSNQTLEFIINNGTIDQSIITSTPIVLTEQDTAIIRVDWSLHTSATYRRIFFNNVQVLESTATFTLPVISNASLFIGCNSLGQEQINGKLMSLKIYG